MSLPEWATEADRLLDAMVDAQLEVSELRRVAKAQQQMIDVASEKASKAQASFDRFINGCVTVRMQADARSGA